MSLQALEPCAKSNWVDASPSKHTQGEDGSGRLSRVLCECAGRDQMEWAEQAVKAEDGEAGGDGYGEFEEGSDIEGGV